MFSKSSRAAEGASQSVRPIEKPGAPSIISTDLRVVGDLSSEGEIQVDGVVDGDIRTTSLLVGQTAEIKGEIVSDNVIVHGSINGQIKARSVYLTKTAHVLGDILHEDLAIEKGAFLEGHCKRFVDEKKSAVAGKIDVVGKDTPSPVFGARSSSGTVPKGSPAVAAASGASTQIEKKVVVPST